MLYLEYYPNKYTSSDHLQVDGLIDPDRHAVNYLLTDSYIQGGYER